MSPYLFIWKVEVSGIRYGLMDAVLAKELRDLDGYDGSHPLKLVVRVAQRA